MNEIIENITIENMIYEIDGKEVMLDSDLAKLYQCANGTKDINKAVKRNINRFPNDFYFQLTELEKDSLQFQSGTANNMTRTNPHVFTEQGIAMLATVLHTKIAEEVSIKIMRTFVKMRHYLNYHKDFLPNRILLLEDKVSNNTKRIDELFDKFNPKDIVKDKIFFEGEFYDAYSLIIDIFNSSKKEIIIISKNIDNILKEKYEKQYHNVIFINNDSFHDRFIIIDRKSLYYCGASLKDLGKKCFVIGILNERGLINEVLELINLPN